MSNQTNRPSGRTGLLTVIGKNGKPMELRTLHNGNKVAETSIAVTEVWGENNANVRTTWYRVSVWGKQAESLSRLINQTGFTLAVSGKVAVDAFIGADGEARANIDLNCSVPGGFVEIAGWPKDYTGAGAPEPEEEDIPF